MATPNMPNTPNQCCVQLAGTMNIFCVSLEVNKKTLLKNRLSKVRPGELSFRSFIERLVEENNLTPTVEKGLDFRDSETQDQEIEVKLSKGLDGCSSHSVSVHIDEDIDIINQFDKSLGLNNITVIISTCEKSEENDMILGESANTTMPGIMNDNCDTNTSDQEEEQYLETVTDVLMSSRTRKKSPCLIPDGEIKNDRDKLHNHMINLLGHHMYFPIEYSTEDIIKNTSILCNALFYLDGRKSIILDRQKREQAKLLTKIPER